MAARDMICPAREPEWGGEECWGEGMPVEGRWRAVLESGCQEGLELRRVWDRLGLEARDAAAWLGEEMEEIFATGVEGVGAGSVTGATRGLLVEAQERIRFRLLTEALARHRPKRDRHAWAWRQRDKLSSAWLLALPGGGDNLTNDEFTTFAAINLCIPPPACLEREGDVIKGRVRVDKHGDLVQSTAVPGDHWRKRHDSIKLSLYRLCLWAGLPSDMEVFNLFSRHIPQEGLARIESNRQRQGMIPDLRVVFQTGGQQRTVLHEVKCISSSHSRYKPAAEDRAVDKRAGELHQEYLIKARNVDQRYGGIEPGVVGPVEAKLLSFERVQGIVFGAFAEVSEPVHRLIDQLATSRVTVAGPQKGRRGLERSNEGERAMVVGMLRRKLSVAGVKAQCSSLLGRLQVIGPGMGPAANRRAHALYQDRVMAREQQAHAQALRHEKNIVRRGFARVN